VGKIAYHFCIQKKKIGKHFKKQTKFQGIVLVSEAKINNEEK
jgi:hypothetical protein